MLEIQISQFPIQMKKIIEYFSMVFIGLPNVITLGSGDRASFVPTVLKVFKFFVNRIDILINIDKFL